MSNYRNFLPEDLAADDSFRRWVLSNTLEDKLFWEKWLMENPDKEQLIGKAKRYLEWTYEAFENISDEEIANEIDRLSQQINEQGTFEPKRKILPIWVKVAASIFLIMGIALWVNRQNPNADAHKELLSQIEEPLQEKINKTDEPEFIVLPDGSNVLLQPKSRITYPKSFKGNKREVFLSGEAFFEISKNAEKPFFVYANTLVTKVLGTSFKVSAFEDEQDVKVVVKTGRVSVFPLSKEALEEEAERAELTGLVLAPNEQIVFETKNQKLTRTPVEKTIDLNLNIQNQSFSFKASKISDVFAALEKAYGIEIEYNDELMKNCYLTADLSDEPLVEKINLICITIGAEFQKTENIISISSDGC
ncbi:FecR family protein [Marinilongibacter aquaticus]|uniref:FecR family protein n=1 Tax=Marinilongibacter aquaticus TaxID=2975157 RepID=UPI0021BCFDEA|nr:FecR family protein [Marinilongibacter aquaticus]UBM59387.1 FecR family protein [Marinilongibacter aquaticus]